MRAIAMGLLLWAGCSSSSEPADPPPLVTSPIPPAPPSPAPVPAPAPEVPAVDSLPGLPSEAMRERVEWGEGYGFDLARTASDVWVSYDREPGLVRKSWHEPVPPVASALRVLPAYDAGHVEHIGFYGVDPATRTALELASVTSSPLVRAPRLDSPEEDADALRASTRLRVFERCFTGRRNRRCLAYGTQAELEAIAIARKTDRFWAPRPAQPALHPPPAAPDADRVLLTVEEGDVAFVLATYGDPRGEMEEVDVAGWIRRGQTHVLAFAFRSYPDVLYDGGIVRYQDQWHVWAWRPEWVALSTSFHDASSLARLGEPMQIVDSSDRSQIDCGNVFTDTRPVLALDSDGWHLAFIWADNDFGLLFGLTPRFGSLVEHRQPGGDQRVFAPHIAPLFRVLHGPGGALALTPMLPYRSTLNGG